MKAESLSASFERRNFTLSWSRSPQLSASLKEGWEGEFHSETRVWDEKKNQCCKRINEAKKRGGPTAFGSDCNLYLLL